MSLAHLHLLFLNHIYISILRFCNQDTPYILAYAMLYPLLWSINYYRKQPPPKKKQKTKTNSLVLTINNGIQQTSRLRSLRSCILLRKCCTNGHVQVTERAPRTFCGGAFRLSKGIQLPPVSCYKPVHHTHIARCVLFFQLVRISAEVLINLTITSFSFHLPHSCCSEILH